MVSALNHPPPAPGPIAGLLLARAGQAWRNGEGSAAEALCREALARTPDHRLALWLLSRLRLEAGDDAGAESLVARIVALNRDDIQANQDLAVQSLDRIDGMDPGAVMGWKVHVSQHVGFRLIH